MSRLQTFITCGIILFILLMIASWANPTQAAQMPPTPSKQLRVFEFPLESGCINTFMTSDAITVRVAAMQALEDKIPAGCYPEVKAVKRIVVTPLLKPDPCLDAKTFSVYFDFDKSAIRDAKERAVIKAAADWVNQCTGKIKVVVSEGNCDIRGTDKYNIALGERRAKSVAGMLEYFGVDMKMIEIVSFGESNAGGVNHQEDRRVDIVVVPK